MKTLKSRALKCDLFKNHLLPVGRLALFFWLSGTGKTTLSADPRRKLIWDDEHVRDKEGIGNIEGGCYAKCINLDPEKEPQIWSAMYGSAILENTLKKKGKTDFTNTSLTQNTRVSYPLTNVANRVESARGGHPKHIFFLTYDAFGVLPPLSRLTKEQAMYYFKSGYTAKVAGTEDGVKEPKATFSACFGAPFLPLHRDVYTHMLGERLEKGNDISIWLVSTWYTGGAYGTGKGKRIDLQHTRNMVGAALDGKLGEESIEYEDVEHFGLRVPKKCPGVPSRILNPKKTWDNKGAYDKKAQYLESLFQKNDEETS